MVAIHIEHKLDMGALTVSFVKVEVAPCETDGQHQLAEIFQFRFECGSTGAWFDADLSHAEFIEICPILGEYDELLDTLNEPPTMTRDLSQNTITATFTAAGRKRSYPIAISLTKRTYAADKQDVMELRAENAVLRRKVANLEQHIGNVSDLCQQSRIDIAHLSILVNRSYAAAPIEIPNGEMSDDILIGMMSPVCEYQDVVDPVWLFMDENKNIMRAIDRGIDPNKIVGSNDRHGHQYSEMPLIFLALHAAHTCDLPVKVKQLDKSIELIKYLLSHGQDVNVKYNNKTILTQFIEYNESYASTADARFNSLPMMPIERMLANPMGVSWTTFPGRGIEKCIEYVEYRDTIIKLLRNAGAK